MRRQQRQQRKGAVVQTADESSKVADGFANLATRVGYGAGNQFSEGTYTFDLLTRNRIKLEAMYRSSWLVGKIVDDYADDMTRAGIEIKGEIDPDRLQVIQKEMVKKDIWGSLKFLVSLGRLYGGAIGVINIEGQDYSTPLNLETVGKGQFTGITPFDRWQVTPDLVNVIDSGPDMGLPKYYRITTAQGGVQAGRGSLQGLNIHHSRVIRSIGIQLPFFQAITEQMWGESVIERLHDRLMAFDSATMGAANLIEKAYLRVVKVPQLREILSMGGKAEENLIAQFSYIRMLQNNEGITLLDGGDEFQANQYAFSGLSDVMLQFGQQVSGAAGIPLVRLFGQSPSGLNSTGESDLRMYYDSILSQQESKLRHGMLKILHVCYRSTFGANPPADLDFDFVTLWQMSAAEKATVAQATTAAVVQAAEAGLVPSNVAMEELKQMGDITGVFTNITSEDIEEAKMEPPPPMVEMGEQEEAQPVSFADKIKAWLGKNG